MRRISQVMLNYFAIIKNISLSLSHPPSLPLSPAATDEMRTASNSYKVRTAHNSPTVTCSGSCMQVTVLIFRFPTVHIGPTVLVLSSVIFMWTKDQQGEIFSPSVTFCNWQNQDLGTQFSMGCFRLCYWLIDVIFFKHFVLVKLTMLAFYPFFFN